MILRCPGQDDRNIKAQNVKCPDCGFLLEIFSDETKIRCPECKNLVSKERLPSCIDWCKFARDCIGEERWRKLKEK